MNQNPSKFIKQSALNGLIREIVRCVVKEVKKSDKKLKEMTGTAAVSPVSTPKAFSKKKSIEEMNTTDGGTPGYNVPGAFSRKGGSVKGVAGSAALGYELTPIGKKEMNRTPDRLLEGKRK